MDADTEAAVEERLAIFDEEADVDDWVEIFTGAFLTIMGLWWLFNPDTTLVDERVMSWIAAVSAALGGVLAGHGLKDMAVKEIRTSIVMLESSQRQGSIDYGLIRDVLLHPDQYKRFLLEAYEEAFADGVLTEEELAELKQMQEALQLTDQEASLIATRAAINAAIRDGNVDANEMQLIMNAAQQAGLTQEQMGQIQVALADGKIDEGEAAWLNHILGQIG